MSVRKTAADIRREQVALDMNAGLLGTGLSVSSNGPDGPYRLTASRLSRGRLERLIRVVEQHRGEWESATRS